MTDKKRPAGRATTRRTEGSPAAGATTRRGNDTSSRSHPPPAAATALGQVEGTRPPTAAASDAAELPSTARMKQTVIIENVAPTVDGGRYAVKREVGATLRVSADIFKEQIASSMIRGKSLPAEIEQLCKFIEGH